jgi:hypothetical protein
MLGKQFEEALVYAAELHRDQVRKGTGTDPAGEPARPTPYVAHLLGVASLALEAGADEEEAIAALLHDALEDQPRDGRTERDIAELFGPDVLAIVKACTKAEVDPALPPERKTERRREIRAAYFDHLRHASGSVLLVSAADKLHNARAIVADLRERGPSAFARFNDDREGTLWYYRGLARALRDGGAPLRLVEGLEDTVAEMHRLARADEPRPEDDSRGESEDAFVRVPIEELPAGLSRRAQESAVAAAREHGLLLDTRGFAPVAAAVRDVAGWSMGVHVVDVRTWRAVGPVRFGGAPALLVAELVLVDGEAAGEVLARDGVNVSIVPFAEPGEAGRLSLEDAPGHLLSRASLP